MDPYRPLIAIVGSARAEITGDQTKEMVARSACIELGQELAKADGRIGVYSAVDCVERDVVRGFVVAGAAGKNSIVCYYPQGASVHFPEMDADQSRLRRENRSDWRLGSVLLPLAC